MENITVGRGRGSGKSRLILQAQNLFPKNVPVVSPLVSSIPSHELDTIQGTNSNTEEDGNGKGTTRHVINWESASETPSVDGSSCSDLSFTTISSDTRTRQASESVGASVVAIEQSPPKHVTQTVTHYASSISSSSSSSTSSSLQDVAVPRKREVISISQFLPKYSEAATPSSRLKTLGSCEVKILKVLDKPGYLMVAFQDKDSVERFSHLLKAMATFYTTPEGFTLRKYGHSLEKGEIVAATVCSCSDESVFRRVKIQNIKIQEDNIVRAHGVDIDSLNHWNIRCAFSLLEAFYRHPSQACQIKISNYTDLYPKGIFEVLFNKRKTFLGVMNQLAHRTLESMVGHSITVSNICTENDGELLSVEVNIDINFRLKALFVEAFCSHFTPIVPTEEGGKYEGIITDVLPSGIIGISQKGSLVGPINQILSSFDLQQVAQSVTENDKSELLERINTRNCRLCIARDKGRSRLVRVKIQNLYGNDSFRVTFLDIVRDDTVLTLNDLVCGITNNPKIPAILALLPAQALSFQLARLQHLTETQCNDIFQKYRNGIKFRVSKNLRIRDSMLEVEVPGLEF